MELGGLRTVSGSVSPRTVDNVLYYSRMPAFSTEAEDEARSIQLRELSFVVRVRVEFAIAQAR